MIFEHLGLAVVTIIALCALYIHATYNRIVKLDTLCERAGSDIDVQLKQRHSLIPNLVETVKGFASHERGIIDAVTAARGRALGAASGGARMKAEAALTDRIGDLMTVVESYPDIRADGHFRDLRSEIADSENKIACARRYHNATIAEYNATLRQFPANVVAAKLHLARRAHYDLGLERVFVEDAPVLKF
jgi:LemA protein